MTVGQMVKSPWIRPSRVAGRFYPAGPNALSLELSNLCPPRAASPAIALMAPHAGYAYSGKTAGLAYCQTEITPTVFILCPNHTGKGPKISVWSEGAWETPLGSIPVDSELSKQLIARVGTADRRAHEGEHAIEVHVPFLKFRRADVKIVPIVLGHLSQDECHKVGDALAEVAVGSLVVASTDMSHFISRAEATRLDRQALRAVEDLDADRLYETVVCENISMCGFIPTTAVIVAAKRLGATKTSLLGYTDSGYVTGDTESVVGYASALFK